VVPSATVRTPRRRAKKVVWRQLVWGVIMFVVAMATVYPFWYCLVYSFSSAWEAAMSPVVLWPVGFTLKNYEMVFQIPRIYNSVLVSIYRTVVGVLYSVLITGLASYAISQRELPGNRIIALYLIIPMYVSGGLIPSYVLISKLGLFNNLLVYILPHGFWAFNMILMRSYFETIPVDMAESARIDGASELTIFRRIMFPLAKPVFAVIAMFNGVWQWNAWFDALLYITKPELRPLQNVLQAFLHQNEADMIRLQAGDMMMATRVVSAETIRMTILIVTVLPITFVYPFFQKHFVRGIMLGAVKA